jgi:hypothetical protein
MAAGAGALLILVGGAVAGVSALAGDDSAPRIVTAVGEATAAAPPDGDRPAGTTPQRPVARQPFDPADLSAPRTSDQADRTATRNPRGFSPQRARATAPAAIAGRPAPAVPPAAAPARPAQTTRTETETREIPFETQLVRDPQLPRGEKRVDAPGVPGEETLRYLVTLVDGKPIDRRLIDATVTRQPQHRVVAFGGRRGFRECGNALNVCVPLGRSAICPDGAADPRHETGDDSAPVLDGDLALLDTGALDDIEELPCGKVEPGNRL